jgi:hypothetical protein
MPYRLAKREAQGCNSKNRPIGRSGRDKGGKHGVCLLRRQTSVGLLGPGPDTIHPPSPTKSLLTPFLGRLLYAPPLERSLAISSLLCLSSRPTYEGRIVRSFIGRSQAHDEPAPLPREAPLPPVTRPATVPFVCLSSPTTRPDLVMSGQALHPGSNEPRNQAISMTLEAPPLHYILPGAGRAPYSADLSGRITLPSRHCERSSRSDTAPHSDQHLKAHHALRQQV